MDNKSVEEMGHEHPYDILFAHEQIEKIPKKSKSSIQDESKYHKSCYNPFDRPKSKPSIQDESKYHKSCYNPFDRPEIK